MNSTPSVLLDIAQAISVYISQTNGGKKQKLNAKKAVEQLTNIAKVMQIEEVK